MAKGGFGNMQQLMAQAQRMQAEMAKKQEQLAQQTVEASSGGGMVTAVVNGAHQLVDLKIAPEVVDPDDVEMLEDLVKAAVGEALAKSDAMVAQGMSSVTGGLNIPGMR